MVASSKVSILECSHRGFELCRPERVAVALESSQEVPLFKTASATELLSSSKTKKETTFKQIQAPVEFHKYRVG